MPFVAALRSRLHALKDEFHSGILPGAYFNYNYQFVISFEYFIFYFLNLATIYEDMCRKVIKRYHDESQNSNFTGLFLVVYNK